MIFQPNQTVYLPDGREAVYVLANGREHLVRVMHEVEGHYDEPPYTYPSDNITTTREVYAAPPVEVWDKQVLAKREQVRELDRELTAKREELRALSDMLAYIYRERDRLEDDKCSATAT